MAMERQIAVRPPLSTTVAIALKVFLIDFFILIRKDIPSCLGRYVAAGELAPRKPAYVRCEKATNARFSCNQSSNTCVFTLEKEASAALPGVGTGYGSPR